MPHTIHCFEPQARPLQVSLQLEAGDEFCVYALSDVGEAHGLRSTVLRLSTEAPPKGAIFLFEVGLQVVGDQPQLRVRRVNRQVTLELIRPDLRSRVTTGTEIKSGSRFEATLPDMRTLSFGLELAGQLAQGAKVSVGGGGGSKARALASMASNLWLIPTAAAIFSAPKSRIVAALQKAAKKLGISPGILMLFLGMVLPIAVSLVYGYLKGRAAAAAQAEAAQLQQDLQAKDQALEAALQAEAKCVAQRKKLVDDLNDLQAKRELQAEMALAYPLSQTTAIELGGDRMNTEDAKALDQQYADDLKAYVVQQMLQIHGTPAEARRCLAQEDALGQDLPRYILLWHPDPQLVCPLGYATVEDGVDRAGSWGISKRAADAFASSQPGLSQAATEDIRLNDRWSAHTLATGVRAVLQALLLAETESRPPVAPSQADIWALALWDAYNRMPTPAEGVMDLGAEACVDQLLLDLAASQEAVVPGQPVLPDISLVAQEEITPAVRPTAGCPWPSDALTLGAQAAVRAVAHLALLEGGESAE